MTDADPVTGLTSKDKQLIRESWTLVGSPDRMTENGVEFLIQLLGANPYMANFFPSFKGISVPELRQDKRFARHATKVMKAIQQEVDNLDDTDALVKLVQHLATVHFKLQVKIPEFENLKAMFVPYLKSVAGSKCTEEVGASWNKLLTAQNAVVKMTQDGLESTKM